MVKKLLSLFLVLFLLAVGVTIWKKIKNPLGFAVKISPTTSVSLLKEEPVKDSDRKYIPSDEKLLKEVPLGVVSSKVAGKEDTATLLISAKCDTCTAVYRRKDVLTSQLGLYWEPKLVMCFDSSGFVPGFAATLFRYDRYTLNGVVGFPAIGAGLAVDITKNFFIIGGLDLRLAEYSNISDLKTYNINRDALTKPLPLVGVGFNF